MDQAHLVQLFVGLFVLPFVVLPAVGGGVVTLGLRLAKLPELPYLRCWKVYLASCCYGFLLLVPLEFALRDSDLNALARQGFQLAVFCGAQLILVPLFLRNFSYKALGVAG